MQAYQQLPFQVQKKQKGGFVIVSSENIAFIIRRGHSARQSFIVTLASFLLFFAQHFYVIVRC